MTRTFASIAMMAGLVALSTGASLSCKGFEAAPKIDAATPDLADMSGSSGGRGGAAVAPGSGGAAGGIGAGSGGTAASSGGSSGAIGSGGAPGCNASQHMCSGACVSNDSIDSCGQRCEPCAPPSGGMATCDGSACDFTCGSSMKKCAAAAICVAATGCCTDGDCPARSGGQTGTCDSGTHACDYGCPAGNKACTAGGATSCLPSTGCCQDSDCPGVCQACSVTTHTCAAVTSKDDPTGRCAGTCDAAGACRSKRGQTCNTTAGGCVSGSPCSPDGYCCDQACEAPCMACDIAGKLGTCSPVASGPPHGSRASCIGTGTPCAGQCGNRSDGACVYPTQSCYDGSGTCDASGARGPEMCSEGRCVTPPLESCPSGCNATKTACLSCPAGSTGCMGVCKSVSTDPENCGACGRVCTVPLVSNYETGPFATATCAGSMCGFTCDAAFMKCPASTPICQRKLWDFEDGTTQGFVQPTDVPNIAHSSLFNSIARAHGGTHSLAVPLDSGGTFVLNLNLCGLASPYLPTSGRALSLWLYVDGALSSSATNILTTAVWGCTDQFCSFASPVSLNPVPVGSWVHVSAPVSAADAAAHPYAEGITLQGELHPSSSTTVYVDDITLQ